MKQHVGRRPSRLASLLVALIGFFGVLSVATPASAATGNILPPFDIGTTWTICRGYDYASHTGTSEYGIDLTGPGCDNSAAGRTVRAPIDGTVAYYQVSYGNLCVNTAGGRSYTLTHISSGITSGTVTAGQVVGTVGAAGAYNNNNVAHIHFQIWGAPNCYNNSVIPFDAAYGTQICGAPDLTPAGPNGLNNGTWSGTVFTGQSCGSNSGGLQDGTYVLASDTGNVYVMAGGAAIFVSSWANVGGPHTINATRTQAQINAMPQYPADGTAVRDAVSGGIWIIAGGFPFAVSNLAHTPGISWTNIDVNSLAYMRSEPLDGTMVRNEMGGIYVISGNAAMAVTSLSNIPYTNWTNVDSWSIANQMRTTPKDGTVFVDYATSTVYVAAGGSALAATSFGNIPPVTSMAYIDHWDLANQLHQYPANGTVIRDYTPGSIYVVAGGSALGISSLNNVPYHTWTNIDGWSITHQLLSYPTDGTYVRDYTTGKVYSVQNGATTYLPSWGSSGPQPYTDIDPWALTNQLHATG